MVITISPHSGQAQKIHYLSEVSLASHRLQVSQSGQEWWKRRYFLDSPFPFVNQKKRRLRLRCICICIGVCVCVCDMHRCTCCPIEETNEKHKQTVSGATPRLLRSGHRKTAETNLPPHMIARVISDRIWNGFGSGRGGQRTEDGGALEMWTVVCGWARRTWSYLGFPFNRFVTQIPIESNRLQISPATCTTLSATLSICSSIAHRIDSNPNPNPNPNPKPRTQRREQKRSRSEAGGAKVEINQSGVKYCSQARNLTLECSNVIDANQDQVILNLLSSCLFLGACSNRSGSGVN